MEPRQITLEEVKQHNKPNDCWMVIDGRVYDVSKFMARHPGGLDPLLESAGLDGSDAFGKIGHSEKAVKMMEKYEIGRMYNPKS